MKLINILQAHMSSPGDDGERKTVMFLTPSPGSSQTSGPGAGSQDEKWSGNVAGDPEENWPGARRVLVVKTRVLEESGGRHLLNWIHRLCLPPYL